MNNANENLLIIFVKNLIPGQVKTRLAAEIGIDGALDVYKFLVEHTFEVTNELPCAKAIYYSEYVEIEDVWDTEKYKLFIQKGNTLGDRMLNAFEDSFNKKFKRVVIIGSDSYELKTHHIEEAFEELESNDVVVGPSKDGGYYLIGMNRNYPQFFTNKTYSHSNVLTELLTEISTAGASFHLLEKLADIDTLQDLRDSDIDFEMVAEDPMMDDMPGYGDEFDEDEFNEYNSYE